VFAFIDEAPSADHTPTEQGLQPRQTADGREWLIPKVYYTPAEMDAELHEAGFSRPRVTTTGRFLLLGEAHAEGRHA
jgi:hypothetical protein